MPQSRVELHLKMVESGYMLYAAWIRQLPQALSMPSAEHLDFYFEDLIL